MHNIGNKRDAELILNWVRDGGMSEDLWNRPVRVGDQKAPEGWKYVGNGAFRSVWLSPEGVTYKVDHTPSWGQCAGEANALTKAWRKKDTLEGCRLPRFDWFEFDSEVVVAMEYIKGEIVARHGSPRGHARREEIRNLLWSAESHYDLPDAHEGNAIVEEDGTLVPVDFG